MKEHSDAFAGLAERKHTFVNVQHEERLEQNKKRCSMNLLVLQQNKRYRLMRTSGKRDFRFRN